MLSMCAPVDPKIVEDIAFSDLQILSRLMSFILYMEVNQGKRKNDDPHEH